MEFSLVDKYAAYQLFSDVWTVISSDLEMIQSEGFECVYKVDPNMVPNKKEKDGEDVLDGYVGHIIPFEIAKKCILTNDYNQIIALQEKLSDISEQYSVILDDLSEEEKEGDFVNEEKDGFDFKYIASESKKIKKSGAALDRINKYIIELAGLNEEEKKAKKELKTKNAKIEEDAKNVIENLDRETALKLLRVKWIVPLIDNINQLPSIIIDELINKINYFVGKYIITLSGTQEQLAENETELISLLRDLNAKDYDSKGISDFISVLGGKKQ